jgi:hypothetical protein
MNFFLLAVALLFSGVKEASAAFSAVSVNSSQFYVGQTVTVTAEGGGLGTYTITAPSVYTTAAAAYTTFSTSYSSETTRAVAFPSASGATFSVTMITGATTFSTVVTQYLPAIVSPTDGATLTPGSTFLASVTVLPIAASSYTITFGNGLYSQVSTIAGNTPVFLLSVPTNYVGSYTLQLTQSTFTDTFTYALPTVYPVWNAANPNLRFHVGEAINYGRRRHH